MLDAMTTELTQIETVRNIPMLAHAVLGNLRGSDTYHDRRLSSQDRRRSLYVAVGFLDLYVSSALGLTGLALSYLATSGASGHALSKCLDCDRVDTDLPDAMQILQTRSKKKKMSFEV
jgi:hypothetical protein